MKKLIIAIIVLFFTTKIFSLQLFNLGEEKEVYEITLEILDFVKSEEESEEDHAVYYAGESEIKYQNYELAKIFLSTRNNKCNFISYYFKMKKEEMSYYKFVLDVVKNMGISVEYIRDNEYGEIYIGKTETEFYMFTLQEDSFNLKHFGLY